MPKPTPTTAVSGNCTYALNASNHPDIGPDGICLGPTATPIPNATPALLEYLRQLPGVKVFVPESAK